MANITVQIDGETKSTICLNLENNLSNVRKQLEQDHKIKLNETLFAKKIGQEFASIAKEDEGETKLKEIIETKILYLQSEFTWKFFIDHLKLEYGRTVDLDRANKKAFTIIDCEMTKIERCQNDTKEIGSMDWDRIAKENLLTNIQDFAKLGVPIESSKIKKSRFRTNTYNISEYSNVSLKFKKLEPTEEFIKSVKIAVESKDPRKFEDITKEFGRFIPKEVVLGGRAYFEEPNALRTLIINAGKKLKIYPKRECKRLKLVGGEKFGAKNSNEQAWIESLKDFIKWYCIRFKDPVSIFQPLPEDLRKQILILIGKKILYTNTEDYLCKLTQPGMPQTFELKNMPDNIFEILRNEDADCSIFAKVIKVIDTETKKDIFTCQTLRLPNEYPRLIIHCIQKNFKEYEYKLKIRLIIIGYDMNFSFNCLNNKKKKKKRRIKLQVNNYWNSKNPNQEHKKSEEQSSINARNIDIPENNYLVPSALIDLIIKNHLVKFINMDEFSTMTNIDEGHFGTISKARWKKTNNFVVCKRLKNIQSICHKQNEAFLHELRMHKRIDFCPRIIQILGISFDEKTHEYLLIMQYADGGNLRTYLQKHFPTLTWDDKIKLAYQIAEGIKYLHGENILHRDLHSKNIVIHQREAKIIDLGTAKSMETETNLHQGVFGMISYIDPKLLDDHSCKYDRRSDIYSLGVLMWELSSGYPPFIGEYENILRYNLISGRRENSIPNTPIKYLKLYQTCWNGNPDLRPSIDQVFTKLGKMLNIQDGSDGSNDDNGQDSENEQTNDDDSVNDNADSKLNELRV